jgi:hypothetical protein
MAVLAPEDSMTEKAAEVLRGYAEDSNLRLSSDDRLTPHFHAMVRTAYQATPRQVAGTIYIVHRDGDRIAILLLSLAGFPYAFMTNGLLVVMDEEVPGRLLFHEGGNPSFVVKAGEASDRTICDISYGNRIEKPHLLLDLQSILAATQNQAISSKVLSAQGLEVKTKRGAASIETATGDSPYRFPIASIALTGSDGDSLAIGPIGTAHRPAANVLGVSLEDVRSLNVPLKQIGNDEAPKFSMSVPEGFGHTSAEDGTGKQFLSVFYSHSK